VLFCIDEFANLGPLEAIEQAVNDIASAGVKLMLAVQRLDDLKKHYGETWENFIASSGAQIWFGASSNTTTEYLEQALGQTQVTLYARGVSTNRGTSSAETLTESYSHTHSLSRTSGTATSKGTTQGQTTGGSKTSSYGTTDGTSAGRNYGPHLFFEPFQRGTTYSRTSGTQRNTADGEQWSSQQGSTETNTENRAETTSDADSTSGGTSRTQQTTEGQSADIREQFHVRPLLLADEARRYLRPMEDNPNDPIAVQEATREHPAYPGLALIRLAGEPDPFFVRKANHDQDPFFVRKFSPNPAFRFVPLDEQPLFGWQITPEFFYELRLDADLSDPNDKDAFPRRPILADRDRCPVVLDLAEDWKPGDRIEAGQPVLAVKPDDPTTWLTVLPPERIETPKSFKVMANGWRRGQPDGTSIMLLRDDAPISVEQHGELNRAFLGAVDWWARTEWDQRRQRRFDEFRASERNEIALRNRLEAIAKNRAKLASLVMELESAAQAYNATRQESLQVRKILSGYVRLSSRYDLCREPITAWLDDHEPIVMWTLGVPAVAFLILLVLLFFPDSQPKLPIFSYHVWLVITAVPFAILMFFERYEDWYCRRKLRRVQQEAEQETQRLETTYGECFWERIDEARARMDEIEAESSQIQAELAAVRRKTNQERSDSESIG
jgi:hypothetical protein